VPFSVAFALDGERTLVVHRTDWNRLDISDAATGARLTEARTDQLQPRPAAARALPRLLPR
jgi:hypothetical protein